MAVVAVEVMLSLGHLYMQEHASSMAGGALFLPPLLR